MYTPNIGASLYSEQVSTDQNEKVDSNTIIEGYFNTPLLKMDKSSRQKFSKKILDLNYMLEQMSQIDTYKTIHSRAAEYIFFSVHMQHSPG